MEDDPIRKAEELLGMAYKELAGAKGGNNNLIARDAAAKAWLAVIEATNGLFVAKGVRGEELPNTHRGRHFLLKQYGDRMIRRLFNNAYGAIHIKVYYEEIIDLDLLLENFDDVREYIELIKKL